MEIHPDPLNETHSTVSMEDHRNYQKNEAFRSNETQDETSQSALPPRMEYIKFGIATFAAGVAIICLFTANLSWLYGSMYNQAARAQALRVLMVDFDSNATSNNDSALGQAMFGAYHHLANPTFPTYIRRDAREFASPADLVSLVREDKYWAAIYVTPGASQRLADAISRRSTSYDANDAMAYVWNEIRYPAATGSVVVPSLLQMVAGTRSAYHMANAQRDMQLLSHLPLSAQATALKAFLDPVGSRAINVRPAAQSTKAFYNTVSLAIPIVQQFFFIVAFNGISDTFGLFTRTSARISGAVRLGAGFIYSCSSALATAGYIWSFREGWAVTSIVFAQTWGILWLMMHIYYMMWDVSTAFLPLGAMPFIIVTFLFLSIAAANSPFELTPGVYRWTQALPASGTLQMLWNLWSGSSVKVYQALPILFSWWLVCMVMSIVSFIHRRRSAKKGVLLSATH